MGDFNALDHFIIVTEIDKHHFTMLNHDLISKDYFHSLDIPSNRYSINPTVNRNGKTLIEICQCHDIKIVNGRMRENRYTAASPCDVASVIDYIVCSLTLFLCIQNFYIDTFDPSLLVLLKGMILYWTIFLMMCSILQVK